MVLEYLRQPVERNAAAEVMHVVNADVCGEPAQYGRKIIVRASVQGRLVLSPTAITFPNCIFELVLYVKEPNTCGGREQHGRKMHD
jgi:hypothetical protein